MIGEVVEVSDGSLEIVLGGWRDAWGFLDLSAGRTLGVAADGVAFGPPRAVGMVLAALPIEADAGAAGD